MKYSSISTNVRDDNDYLDEWVKYHLGIGFEHITIYDHKSVIPVQSIWGNNVTVIRTEKEELRTPEIIHMETLRERPSYWLAIIDVDEFIVPLQHTNINNFLSKYEKHGGIGIPWTFYGSDGRTKQSKGLVRDSYLWRTPDKEDLGKIIINTQYCLKMMDPHYINASKPVVNEAFKVYNGSIFDSPRKLVKLHHYFTRSYEEWIKKIKRGSGNPNTPERPISWYYDILKGCNIYDPIIKSREDIPASVDSSLTLKGLWDKYGNTRYSTDKECDHMYFEIYDKLFLPFREKKIGVFEVGVSYGGSCKIWDDYFTKALIRGIDIFPYADVPTFSNRTRLDLVNINEIKPDYFDDFPVHIAIDDGSHNLDDQIAFVKLMYPIVQEGGILIMEDIVDPEGRIPIFEALGYPFEVVDLRPWNGRWDNVLFIYRK